MPKKTLSKTAVFKLARLLKASTDPETLRLVLGVVFLFALQSQSNAQAQESDLQLHESDSDPDLSESKELSDVDEVKNSDLIADQMADHGLTADEKLLIAQLGAGAAIESFKVLKDFFDKWFIKQQQSIEKEASSAPNSQESINSDIALDIGPESDVFKAVQQAVKDFEVGKTAKPVWSAEARDLFGSDDYSALREGNVQFADSVGGIEWQDVVRLASSTSAPVVVSQLPTFEFNPAYLSLLGLAAAGGGGGGGGILNTVAGGGGGGGGGILNTVAGVVADGYIRGALVYREDPNNPGNPLNGVVVTTDANGRFTGLPEGTGRIVATGGVDITTGLAVTYTLYAPANSTVVNPITTLIQKFAEANNSSIADATQAIKSVMGLSGQVDFLNYDPIAVAMTGSGQEKADALANQIKAVQVANILVTGSSILLSASPDTQPEAIISQVLSSVIAEISSKYQANTTISLSDNQVIANILPGVSAGVVTLIAQGNGLSPATLSNLYEVQKAIQGDLAQVSADIGQTSAAFVALNAMLNAVATGQKVIDVSLAPSSDTGISDSDRITNLANPSFRVDLNSVSGTVQAGHRVTLSAEGVTSAEVVLSPTDITRGYVDFSIENLGSDGSKVVTVTVTSSVIDPQTQQTTTSSIATGFLKINLDTSVGSLTPGLTTDSGLVGDRVTNTTNIQVTKEPGAIVEFSSDQVNWSTSQPTPINGANTVFVRQTDMAGNVSSISSLTFTYDPQAPSAPSLVANAKNLAGFVNTNVVTITGLAEAGSDVRLYDINGNIVGSAVQAGGDGAFSFFVSGLSDTDYRFTAKATDLAGNVSLVSTPLTFTVDTTAPGRPNVVLTSDTGSNADDKVTSNNALTISSLVDGAIVQYSLNDQDWQATVPTSNSGSNTVYVRQIDLAGNISTSTSFTYNYDASAPIPPSALDTLAKNAAGLIGSANAANVTITGSAEPNAFINIYDSNGITVLGSGHANGAGAFEIALSNLQNRAYSISAKATDLAGNNSVVSSALTFTVDTIAPVVPNTLASVAKNINGFANVANPIVTGVAEANSVVAIYDDSNSTVLGTATADAQGRFSVQLSGLTDRNYNFRAKATDPAGNTSSLSTEALSIQIDSLAPAQPTALSSVNKNAAGYANTLTPVITGSAEPGSTVKIYASDNTLLGTGVANQSGNFTITLSTLTNTSYSLVAKATDLAGNTSVISNALTMIVDTQAPSAPSVNLTTDTGIPSTDRITNDASLSVTGAEAGSTIQYSSNDSSWTASPPTPIEGVNTVYVRQLDIAGNPSPSISLSYTLDTQVDRPILALTNDTGDVSDDLVTSDGRLTVTLLEANARVEYSATGQTDSWSSTQPPLSQGINTVYVRQIDPAGNI
jgi:hypothetical protein